ncbi:MAG: GAF domain-containing protein, partial [Chloroflexi bacterium]|nr:GAF domain-containing protein [Chloroflexota bacterium]
MQTESGIDTQLKEAVQLTGSAWAVLAERVGGVWLVRASYHLNKSAQNELTGIMAASSTDAWLCGALSGGHARSAEIPENRTIGKGRFFAFPITSTSKLLLVGAESEQTTAAQRIWRLTASLLSGQYTPKGQTLLPDLQSGLAFDLPVALEKVLGNFVQTVPCQGAWMAIRRGESLDIQAEWNAPKSRGASLLIDDNPIFRRVNRSLSDLLLTRGQPNFDQLPFTNLKPTGGAWICLPLVIGQRLIGVVAMWRQKEFTTAERGQLRELTMGVPQTVDIVVTFSEMSSHLRRLGLLNDFVLTVSSAQNLDQIARRMFGLLTRAFNTELIAIFLKSSDGRILRDYRLLEGKLKVVSISVTDHPIQTLLKEGRVRRISDSSREGFVGIHRIARSELIVPLRYRGQATGVLVIENTQAEAFSQYDEHLMVV